MEKKLVMRLLICTQLVDSSDSTLGFFHRWIEEFAKHCEHVNVICLRAGAYTLPKNVSVHSLGKKSFHEDRGIIFLKRIIYSGRFYRYLWQERENYDAVFVHMNPEYLLIAGILWRVWRKRISLWYVHKSVSLRLRIATLLSHIVFTASPESFRLHTNKLRIIGHGIDTKFFTPDRNTAKGNFILSVGRLMKIKRHDLVIRAAALAGRELHIAGEGPERGNLEMLARSLSADVRFLGGLTQLQLRDKYRKAVYLIHTSETGSLDKVVLEALACGLAVITTSVSLVDLPVATTFPMLENIAERILEDRPVNATMLAVYVREKHSLSKLVSAIVTALN